VRGRSKKEGSVCRSPCTKHYSINKLLGRMVGLSRFELLTPRLSSVCSNQLSYRPDSTYRPYLPVFSTFCPGTRSFRKTARSFCQRTGIGPILSKLDRRVAISFTRAFARASVVCQIDLQIGPPPRRCQKQRASARRSLERR
jgi:hypothetical protein